MIESATGLILRTRPLTETSLIVHWLTPELGRIATVAKGARRPKSPFRGKLDLFYLADFTFVRSRRSELHSLREVGLREAHNGLRQELGYLQVASYCTALIEQATEIETPLTVVFELMSELLRYLPSHPPGATALFAFEIKLLTELGLQPDFQGSRLDPGTKGLFRVLGESEWDRLGGIKASHSQVEELARFLQHFLVFHLGRVPANRKAALSEITEQKPSGIVQS
jgi:DNA repair protein RecO (recombination protein O)